MLACGKLIPCSSSPMFGSRKLKGIDSEGLADKSDNIWCVIHIVHVGRLSKTELASWKREF